jgi:hypothetical protein
MADSQTFLASITWLYEMASFAQSMPKKGNVVDGKNAKDQSFLQKMRHETSKTTTVADLLNPNRKSQRNDGSEPCMEAGPGQEWCHC